MSSSNAGQSDICRECSRITFEMLHLGFQHSLTYQQAIESGRTCKLCRLMVCTLARTQIDSNCYEVNQTYDNSVALLKQSKSVLRHNLPSSARNLGFMMESMVDPPRDLEWKRHWNIPGLCGSFGEGTTIQISAPEGIAFINPYFTSLNEADSVYLSNLMIDKREILEADCSRNVGLLCGWLYGCIVDPEHAQCKKSLSGIPYNDNIGNTLPSRVIYIDGLSGSISAKLYITNGEKSRYTALSHRWGKLDKIMTLNKTLNLFQDSLPMDELPMTFKDAIILTRKLGISYLWIDSLCIIQDDPEDWKREAAQMGTIFERATCTIAAVDAIDDETDQDIGLFNSRHADPLAVRINCPFEEGMDDPPSRSDPYWEGRLESLDYSSVTPSNRQVVLRPRWKGLWHTISESKWHERAWIYQERILSRRIIYYTKRKIFWECQKISSDEENRPNTEPSIRSHLSTMLDQLNSIVLPVTPWDWVISLDNWRYQIAEYSASQITKEKDKFHAFQGVCGRMERRLKCKIFAGVLLDGYLADLLWSTKTEPSALYVNFHAPSWSWAAFKGAISYYDYNLDCKFEIQFRRFKIEQPSYCLRAKSASACQDGVCGIMCFNTSFGIAIAAESLSQMRSKTNDALIHVLGSAVHYESQPVPRRTDDTTLHVPDRRLFLPPHTQVLRDKITEHAIGWYVSDRHMEPGKNHEEILCANIRCWRATKIPGIIKTSGRVQGFNYADEENVDFIGMQVDSDSPSLYRRIGRGRVVKKGWIDSCHRKYFKMS